MMQPLAPEPELVLFDLDGTLVDSAPDLIAAAGVLCRELGEPPPEGHRVREAVSAGGRAILRRALPNADAVRIDVVLPRFLDIYAGTIAVQSRLFPGLDESLVRIERAGIPWGIVTNKPVWLARPLLDALGLSGRCAVLVGGDTLVVKKPDPEPVRHACAAVGADPSASAFVGDDPRDVEAGRAAGTRTLVAAWGYLDGADPRDWGADAIVTDPSALPLALGIA